MSDTSGNAVWGVFGGSTQGSSHQRTGLPNQDSLEKWARPDGSLAVLAVSDGHGSASHFRSEIGSRIGVDTAVQALRDTPIPVPDQQAEVLARSIVDTWHAAVMAHLEEHPFTDQEWNKLPAKDAAQMKAAVLANPLLAYGATLLAVLAAESEVLYLQLGDGDILAVDQNGGTTRPVPEDKRLIANQTTSLCQRDAARDFRSAHLRASDGPLPALVLVSSDGYANSFVSDQDFLRLGPDYLELLREYGAEKVQTQLQKILPEASRKGSGDDITLGIVQRTNATAKPLTPTAPTEAVASADPAPTAPAPSPAAEPKKADMVMPPAAADPKVPPMPVTAFIPPRGGPDTEATMLTRGRKIGRPPEMPEQARGGKDPGLVVNRFSARPAAAASETPVEEGTAAAPVEPPAAEPKLPGESMARPSRVDTSHLQRKIFWLKIALAGVFLIALTGGALTFFRPVWVSNVLHLIRPSQEPRGHPDDRKPSQEPRNEPRKEPRREPAPHGRNRSRLLHDAGLLTAWSERVSGPRIGVLEHV
jgi:serine/threonine protein phosphatase PrpC